MSQIRKNVKDQEVSERKQVGDVEAVVNEGTSSGFDNHAGEL
jgi:hypothetical protein